jgi:hypothetical protein
MTDPARAKVGLQCAALTYVRADTIVRTDDGHRISGVEPLSALTTTALRADLYRILDGVLETGVPVDIERNGRRLRIVPTEGRNRLSRLRAHPGAIVGDREELVHMDWSDEWRP